MKRLKIKLALTFAAGIVSGLMLAVGIRCFPRRPTAPGGEVLILPLIVLLIYVGVQFGMMLQDFKGYLEYQRGYEDGYETGREDGTIEVRPVSIRLIDLTRKASNSNIF